MSEASRLEYEQAGGSFMAEGGVHTGCPLVPVVSQVLYVNVSMIKYKSKGEFCLTLG